MENYSNLGTAAFFTAIVLGMFLLLVTGIGKGLTRNGGAARGQVRWRTAGIGLTWLLMSAVMAESGFLQDFNAVPPRFVFLVIPPLAGMLAFGFSRWGTRILNTLPPYWFIYLQTFRVLVEVVLWLLFLENLVPVQMTFEGRNWDILVGLTAPLAGYHIARNSRARKVGIIWNMLGLGLVLNIVVVSVLSAPTPFRVFLNEPANTVVAYFPYMWLPGFLVPIAIVLHILSLRQLLRPLPPEIAPKTEKQTATAG